MIAPFVLLLTLAAHMQIDHYRIDHVTSRRNDGSGRAIRTCEDVLIFGMRQEPRLPVEKDLLAGNGLTCFRVEQADVDGGGFSSGKWLPRLLCGRWNAMHDKCYCQ